MPETLRIDANRLLTVLPRGGDLFTRSLQPISRDDLLKLRLCAGHWPEENREAVESIEKTFTTQPATQQLLACETAFFASLPEAAAEYALPQSQTASGLRRYGADGLFHAWVAGQYPQCEKLISVHLSGNTTLAAIRAGQAVDTSAGYSLLEGLPGLTTCGDLDPSLLFVLNEQGTSLQEIRHLLYFHSGWQSFVQKPITYAQFLTAGDKELELPRSMYFHALIKQIGAMLSVLGGADRIVFAAESAQICENFVQKIRCHFYEKSFKFKLIEIQREKILNDLANG